MWGYKAGTVVGTVWLIPLEEYAFFLLQTLLSCLWAHLVFYERLPLLNLRTRKQSFLSRQPLMAQFLPLAFFILMGAMGWHMSCSPRTQYFYLGSILWWISPVLFIQWAVGARYIINMGFFRIFLACFVPTLYLWIVDYIALQNGSWFISEGTKLEHLQLFGVLPIEECVFFLTTNIMVVFGFLTIDHCLFKFIYKMGIDLNHCNASDIFKGYWKGMRIKDSDISESMVEDVSTSLELIKKGSKTFYLASLFFPAQVREDIMQLYSWCRVCDDLVDSKVSQENCHRVVRFLDTFLDQLFGMNEMANVGDERKNGYGNYSRLEERNKSKFHLTLNNVNRCAVEYPLNSSSEYSGNHCFLEQAFNGNALNAFDENKQFISDEIEVVVPNGNDTIEDLLPLKKLAAFRCMDHVVKKHGITRNEVKQLIDGFKWDMEMDTNKQDIKIKTVKDLFHYSSLVASSVGVMCCRIFGVKGEQKEILERAEDMGIAMQLTNVARYSPKPTTKRHIDISDFLQMVNRDIVTDAKLGRVYIPLEWFDSQEERNQLLENPYKNPTRLKQFANMLTDLAEHYYQRALEGVAMLPPMVSEAPDLCVVKPFAPCFLQ